MPTDFHTRQTQLDPASISQIEGLDVKARLIVEGLVAGAHRGPHQGLSVEFAEHRNYVPGDDLRYIDWKVFGKSDRFYLKRFEEETDFACYILLDVSESMAYQSADSAISKFQYAQYLAAALSYLVLNQHDAVGLVVFDSKLREFIPASSRSSQFRHLTTVMEDREATGKSSVGHVLHEVAERLNRRSVLLLLSDFFDEIDQITSGLNHLKYSKHDVGLLQIIDPAEQSFPFDEPMLFQGLEGWTDQIAEPRTLRRAYQKEFFDFLQALKRVGHNLQMDYTLTQTDNRLDLALSRFLNNRHIQPGRK